MASAVTYTCKQYEFIRPSGVFHVPNFRNRGLIPRAIEFDKSCEKLLRDNVKELKVTIGGSNILYKGLSGSFFAHNNVLPLDAFESQILNSNSKLHVSITTIPLKDATAVTKPLAVTVTVHYKEIFGEPRSSTLIANNDDFIKFLREQENPYKIAFKPQNPLPDGFLINSRLEIVDKNNVGYDIFDATNVQNVINNGAIVEWDFGFTQDAIVREHFCLMVEPIVPNKSINIYPMTAVVYTAND
jgi:hypothetical protein